MVRGTKKIAKIKEKVILVFVKRAQPECDDNNKDRNEILLYVS